jgi:hypothetical protein
MNNQEGHVSRRKSALNEYGPSPSGGANDGRLPGTGGGDIAACTASPTADSPGIQFTYLLRRDIVR